MDANATFTLGEALSLWDSQDRRTARVMLVLTLSSTSLLLLWAMGFVIVRGSRSVRREHKLRHFLNVLYVSCLLLAIIYFTCSLYVNPNDPFCPNLKAVSYFLAMATLSTNMMTSWHAYMTSCQESMTSLLSGTPYQMLLIYGLYFFVPIGIPLINMSLHIQVQSSSSAKKSFTTCWLALQDIWWLIVPVLLYMSASLLITVTTCSHFRSIPARHRCKIYASVSTNLLFTLILTATQIDTEVHSITTSFTILCLFLIHNVAVWLTLTENILEICPGAMSVDRERGIAAAGASESRTTSAHRAPGPSQTEQRADDRHGAGGNGGTAATATPRAHGRGSGIAGIPGPEESAVDAVFKSISVDDVMGATATMTFSVDNCDLNHISHPTANSI